MDSFPVQGLSMNMAVRQVTPPRACEATDLALAMNRERVTHKKVFIARSILRLDFFKCSIGRSIFRL